MLQVLGIDHVVLRVVDRERALGFYCGVLGLSIEREQPELGLTQLRAGRSLIDLITFDGVLGRRQKGPCAAPGARVDHIALEVAALDATAVQAHLGRHGVDVIEAGSRYGARGEGLSFYVHDPDGNKIELKGPPTVSRGSAPAGSSS
jgi:glyoxylase I family protein